MKINLLPQDKRAAAAKALRDSQIKRKLEKVKQSENILEALIKFLKTSKGQRIVNDFDKYSMDELASKYGFKFVLAIQGHMKRRNIFISACAKAGLVKEVSVHRPQVNAKRVKEMQKIGMLKPPKDLTREEIRSITDRTHKKQAVGIAARLKALEEHKMLKWDTRIWPRIKEKLDKRRKEDLFPDMFGEPMRKQLREAHLEEVRKMLSDKYCPVSITVVSKIGDEVEKHAAFRKIKLGKLRSDKLDCHSKIGTVLAKKLNVVMTEAQEAFGRDNVTCIHLNSHNPRRGRVLTPTELAKLAALSFRFHQAAMSGGFGSLAQWLSHEK